MEEEATSGRGASELRARSQIRGKAVECFKGQQDQTDCKLGCSLQNAQCRWEDDSRAPG